MEEQPKMIDLDNETIKSYDNAIVLISNGATYFLQLPDFGTTEIITKNGKIVTGRIIKNWKV